MPKKIDLPNELIDALYVRYDVDYNLKELSLEIGVSPSTLERAFKSRR